MKVLMGHFTLESNEHVEGLTELDSFNLKFGESLVKSMYVEEIFRKNNIDIIPAIYADGHTAKVLSKEAYHYIHTKFLRAIKEHLRELDGIYLFLHGASKVEGLSEGSGERQLLKDIRKLTGPYLPICVVMDPHGNLTNEYVSQMTLGRCYRYSPHTDIKETHEIVAQKMIDLLKNKKSLVSQYRKLPFVLGGERSVSKDEPMIAINRKLDEIEKDPRILSVSFHVGYLRHDNYAAGSGLIVVPSDMRYETFANQVLEDLYEFLLSKYKEFDYHGNALEVEESVEESIKRKEQHIIVTDSGDNATSGATGENTYLLNQYLNLDQYYDKKILFAGITDEKAFYSISHRSEQEEFTIELGNGKNNLSQKTPLTVQLKQKGSLQQIFGDTDNYGETITLTVKNKPIDIMLISKSVSLAEYHQFEAANIQLTDYNIVIVKQGYIFPELNEFCDYAIMSLTEGPTNQKTENIFFRQIKRPMLPFDNINNFKKDGNYECTD
ncbi:M81 family metallopeptidase [Marinilactibacillus psychrotolerans]|uniref:M81 family metallopeptidase n=1 Tax=Marinilactibacillus psychrotolerans TaxID=191770 RepID=A0A5R9C8B9_9LACT|nr:M81 family metallopeptidase [Marinilactibacillus psychrotolerans]TLQ09587.1 M81 family metallopeptidase [Marinilactibacillus psychrotolerans]